MAETGGKSPLDDEIEALISGGNTASVISGGGIGRSAGQVSVQFDADQDFPLLSLVSMIAPNPTALLGYMTLHFFRMGSGSKRWSFSFIAMVQALTMVGPMSHPMQRRHPMARSLEWWRLRRSPLTV